jgi:hypothetical protein
MAGHASKLSGKQCEAIAVLLRHPHVPDAARRIEIPAKKLSRWIDHNETFKAALRAATRAEFHHQMARLRLGGMVAVKSTINDMHSGTKPADRLQAALMVIDLAKIGNEIEELEGALQSAGSPAAMSLQPGARKSKGHGAKSPGKQKQAIVALLEQPSFAQAAHATGIGVQTLYRWWHEQAFHAAFTAAAHAVWSPAMRLVNAHLPYAVSQLHRSSMDPAVPDAVRRQAKKYIFREKLAHQMAVLEAGVAELDNAGGEPPVTSKTITRVLYQRVQQFRARALQSTGPVLAPLTFVRAIDGRPAGSSVKGPDGRLVWLDPPAGCKAGDPVDDEAA